MKACKSCKLLVVLGRQNVFDLRVTGREGGRRKNGKAGGLEREAEGKWERERQHECRGVDLFLIL